MKEYIFRDKIGYVTDEISTVSTDLANYSEEHRIKFVTDLAAVSRGKDESNNPEGRYKQLLIMKNLWKVMLAEYLNFYL